ncbi:hypothetical protein FXO38_11908 [Capsicum annuum]|nr:hypothetical protein FXO38_11908 [Capsicum annuum]
MSIHKFTRMDNLLEASLDVERDIKLEKEVTKSKIGNQISSNLSQGPEFKKAFEKKTIEKSAPKYPPREGGGPHYKDEVEQVEGVDDLNKDVEVDVNPYDKDITVSKFLVNKVPIEDVWPQEGTITMEPVVASAILAKLEAITRQWKVINKRLDHMEVPREQVGYPDTRQDEDRSSCELRGKNVIPYTHMNIVVVLPSVGVHESSFCDTLDIVRSHEDQTLVVGTQALVDPLDDEIDSPRENDLCPSGVSTYNLTKGEQNNQSGVDDLDLLEYLENPNCDCLCEDDFDCWLPVMVFHDIFNSDKEGLLNFEDDTLGESESDRDLSPWLRLPFDPGLDSRSNPFQEGKDDTSQMATLIFEDMIEGHHLKAQDLVTPKAQEYARKTHFLAQARPCVEDCLEHRKLEDSRFWKTLNRS